MNKTEMSLMNKVMEGSIELKMSLYKALGEDLVKIQNELAALLGNKEVKYVAPVAEDVKPESKKETKVEAPKVKAEEKKEIKANHKVSNVKKLINCGPSEGDNKVLFVEKRKDSKHLWYGQIRLNSYIRNFHWSNELDMPVVYGVEDMTSLKEARGLIRDAVAAINPKELTMYDSVVNHPDFGGFKGRQYLGALHQGAYIYLTPEATDSDKDTDIIAKGYTNGHAFIVRRDQEVFWRNYNYIFSKKPFESTPSKGFDTKTLVNNVSLLFNAVCNQFDKSRSAYFRSENLQTKNVTSTNASTDDAATKDISGLY